MVLRRIPLGQYWGSTRVSLPGCCQGTAEGLCSHISNRRHAVQAYTILGPAGEIGSWECCAAGVVKRPTPPSAGGPVGAVAGSKPGPDPIPATPVSVIAHANHSLQVGRAPPLPKQPATPFAGPARGAGWERERFSNRGPIFQTQT